MRKNREQQRPLAPVWPDHRLSDELRKISEILDENPEILGLVSLVSCRSHSYRIPQGIRRSGETGPFPEVEQ